MDWIFLYFKPAFWFVIFFGWSWNYVKFQPWFCSCRSRVRPRVPWCRSLSRPSCRRVGSVGGMMTGKEKPKCSKKSFLTSAIYSPQIPLTQSRNWMGVFVLRIHWLTLWTVVCSDSGLVNERTLSNF